MRNEICEHNRVGTIFLRNAERSRTEKLDISALAFPAVIARQQTGVTSLVYLVIVLQ